jgi:ATP-dependent DNA helicase RecG
MSDIEQILFSPITKFINIKLQTKEAIERLGIRNIRDLLFHRPNSYVSNKFSPESSDLKHGDRIVIEVTIAEIQQSTRKNSPTKIYTESKAGPIVLVFFHKIPVFIFNKLRIGSKHIIEGTVELNDFYFQIRHPDFLLKNSIAHKIEPIYPLTYALNNKQLVNYIDTVLRITDVSDDPIFRAIYNALKILHNPASIQQAESQDHIKILAKYELLANQINLALIRKITKKARGRSFTTSLESQEKVLDTLGFTLTNSQKQALKEIETDQLDETRMVRMLQGDVGSGKTLIALLTILNVMNENIQSVIMAPTDLLAIQHYEFFIKALGNQPYIGLLTRKTKSKNLLQKLENGEILILIGTHAVFQEKVNFKNLAYIIIDEQHRFGVEQRLELINKANMPDLLVMTATPIPRSLTLTLFGDMASSKLLEKPKGRLPIITTVMPRTRISDVMQALERKMQIGEKIYWICPLINKEDLEDTNEHLMDTVTRLVDLQKIYGDKVGLVHGKMKNNEKDEAMQRFKEGVTQILVATTVIEVGIDVPDATLIIIENAEKFGLASLHQLRGRVGRSSLQSHAILLYENTRTTIIARKRLEIMRNSEDGFYIAEQDLLLRGGGEILGTKQSGEQDFIFANLKEDMDLLVECNKFAESILLSSNPISSSSGEDPRTHANSIGTSVKSESDFNLLLKIFSKEKNPKQEKLLE